MKSLPLLIAAATVAGAYSPPARRWILGWGATPAERERRLPGDDLVAAPDLQSTRAVTIDAPPASVWPWLVQMGSGRGGAYSYDWVENFAGLDMHSADRILPQFQDLALGDEVPLGGNAPRLRVEIRDPDHTLALLAADGAWLWSFHLVPHGPRTRLISRNRIALPTRARRLTGRLFLEPGSLIMERRMLLGIKERVERTPRALLQVPG
jgi:hypothetical protein